ncbi:hypothetical protein ACJ73_02591 [Blastomyces percursus]|uniref:Uncharacterized protein n=1 Tax=Blastomyces percursus TaxID=1658174 RepID=A0A1J9R0S4_9EURO|nr:hypothetical protein ACJ73_02591 [Blastomyces percursus]
MAVSECQEELNNAIIHHQQRVEAAENNLGTSGNTKYTAPFTVSEIDEYATETRIRRNGYAPIITNDHQQHRTYRQEHNILHQQRVDAPKSHPPNLKKHQTYSPSTERNLCPLSTYAPWMESGLGPSTFLPDNSLRNRSVGSTRQRHGVEGTDTTETATE